MKFTSKEICKINENEQIVEYTLENPETNFSMSFLNLGGVITQVVTLDKEKKPCDVVIGFQDKSDYIQNPMYFNAIVGRVCGRISDSKFKLNGTEYALFTNNGKNHLHGGKKGFSHRLWTVEATDEGARLKYTSAHMEEGYPGELKVSVEYSLLREAPGYKITMTASTDRPTLVNLNTHEYFNLSGGRVPNAYDCHKLLMPSQHFLDMTEDLIPSGKILSVEDHPTFDFRAPKMICENREISDKHWAFMKGFDHSFLVQSAPHSQPPNPALESQNEPESEIPLAAILSCEVSGIELEIRTNQKMIHFYGGEFLDPDLGGVQLKGKKNQIYSRSAGICFECQGYDNAANVSSFPSIKLEPGNVYRNETIRSFRTSG